MPKFKALTSDSTGFRHIIKSQGLLFIHLIRLRFLASHPRRRRPGANKQVVAHSRAEQADLGQTVDVIFRLRLATDRPAIDGVPVSAGKHHLAAAVVHNRHGHPAEQKVAVVLVRKLVPSQSEFVNKTKLPSTIVSAFVHHLRGCRPTTRRSLPRLVRINLVHRRNTGGRTRQGGREVSGGSPGWLSSTDADRQNNLGGRSTGNDGVIILLECQAKIKCSVGVRNNHGSILPLSQIVERVTSVIILHTNSIDPDTPVMIRGDIARVFLHVNSSKRLFAHKPHHLSIPVQVIARDVTPFPPHSAVGFSIDLDAPVAWFRRNNDLVEIRH